MNPGASAAEAVGAEALPVTAFLAEAARRTPDRAALLYLGNRISYRRLRREVRSVAAGLARRGIGYGDRVSIVMPSCPQHVVAWLAIVRLGAVVVEHHPLAPAPELERQMAVAGSRAAIVVDHAYGRLARVREGSGLRFVAVTALSDYLPPARKVTVRLVGRPEGGSDMDWLNAGLAPDPTSLGFMEFVRSPRGTGKPWPVRAEDPAALVFGGGPLATLPDGPRGSRLPVPAPVVLTHRNLTAAGRQLVDVTGWRQDGEVVALAVPLFTAFGTSVMAAGLLSGATLALIPRLSVPSVHELLHSAGASVLATVPPVLQALADIPAMGRPYVATAVTGGMPWSSPEEASRVSERLGVPITPLVGTAETSGVALVGATTGPVHPVPGTELTVRSRDVLVRGPQVAPGHRLTDGTLVPVTDGEGWARLPREGSPSGACDVIVTGGLEVSREEVEILLRQHPDVADALVTSVPHARRGQAVRAYVAPAPGRTIEPAALTTYLRAVASPHKIPRETVVVADLTPVTGPSRAVERTLGP